jgi:hypothetical protein
MLGYGTRMQVHALLKEHDVYLNYSLSDVEQDIRPRTNCKQCGWLKAINDTNDRRRRHKPSQLPDPH